MEAPKPKPLSNLQKKLDRMRVPLSQVPTEAPSESAASATPAPEVRTPLSETSAHNQASSTSDGFRLDFPISNHVLGDQPAGTSEERLGFSRYVAAITEFLTDPYTKTPLTLSIEGQWGSGKSSFMLQLEDALRSRGHTKVVRFNAWQYNSDDGLWAAFIRDFDRQLNQSLSFREKIAARFRLVRLRISWQDAAETVKMLVWLIASSIALFAMIHYFYAHLPDFTGRLFTEGDPKKAASRTIAVIGGAGGSAAAILLFFNQIHDLFGSPANLRKGARLFARPDYSEKLPLIHQITQDFHSLVSAYAGNGDVYVFVDDLDRCEYSKAAELMQAMLTLLSSAPSIALIVGLDRDKVAAALAAKQEKLLPYLYNVETKDTFAIGMQYGHRFLEKFIQLSYTVPVPRPSGLKAMINPTAELPRDLVLDGEKSPEAIRIINGADDSQTLNILIDMADQVFDHNPRNVKQFINAFRLQTFIANETGLLRNPNVTRAGKLLALPQLAKFVALSMRWPRLIEQTIADPALMDHLEKCSLRPTVLDPPQTAQSGVDVWLHDHNLRALLSFRGNSPSFILADINFRKLSEVVPIRSTTNTNDFPSLREERPVPRSRAPL